MANDSIKLKLINKSADCNNSRILIFQKNVATDYGELGPTVAWKVVENLGRNWMHPFEYPLMFEVGATDSYGNSVPPQETADGVLWTVVQDCSGDQLQQTGGATDPNEVEVLNGLAQGAIRADVYRDGKLLATKTSVAPGQKAVFQFHPKLFIGVVSEVEEGDVLSSAILTNVNTELSLFGIASADIVMTGGGPGRGSTPFNFTLQNVSYR